MMALCSACGTDNKPGRRFCAECGSALTVGCPGCGTAYEPGERFCGACGSPLVAGATPPAVPGAAAPALPTRATAAVAERRLVTVLFADLVGFTPFAAERDAEDVRAMLTRYFDLASDVITRYGGTVEKFIGDAVMAVWGAPVARENDPELAIRAGLELVDAVRTLGPTIQARAGVLTGEAAVTIGATNQGMVAGDIVNTAARLQSVAMPGTVLAGEATMRASSGAIAYEPAGPQTLKGKESPVVAYRALRVVAEVGGRNRQEGLEAPFVGRDDEMRQLKDQFHSTARDGRTRLVSVIGPAGIGAGDWGAPLEDAARLLRDDLETSDWILLTEQFTIAALLRGDPQAAAMLDQARAMAGDNPAMVDLLDDRMAYAAWVVDDQREASARWRHYAEWSFLNAAAALPRAARAGLWAGDVDSARRDLEATIATGLHGKVIDAQLATMRAGIAVLEGRTGEARAGYRDAIGRWRELRQDWFEALTCLDLVLLLGPDDPDAAAATDRAREVCERLGARPFLERLDAALAPAGSVGNISGAASLTRPTHPSSSSTAPTGTMPA